MKTILHVDMNSYFATLEQQANPFLRGKPIAIGGSGHGGVVVTASVEAKKLGVKVPISGSVLRRKFPQVKIVSPTFGMYSDTTKKLLKIFQEFSPIVEVFSADEAFMDITQTVKRFEGTLGLSRELKRRVKEEIGEWVTCSVGVAPNKLMAKLASNMKKPDGFIVILPQDAAAVARSVDLSDFCGLGPRLERRLKKLGIKTVARLQEIPLDVLEREFGPHCAHWLNNLSFGRGSDDLVSLHDVQDEKSIGHQQTIKPTVDRDRLLETLLHLSEKVGRRLRRKGFRTRTISVHIRFQSFLSEGKRVTLQRAVSDGFDVYTCARRLLDILPLLGSVRLVAVTTSNLERGLQQGSLFCREAQRMENALSACDAMNDRYGEMVVRRGRLLNRKEKKDIPGLGFQKRFLADESSSTTILDNKKVSR